LIIGIFDSGIGGLTVLKKALEFLPNTEYIYYADIKNVPYGVKQKHEVKDYVFNAFDFLSQKGIRIAVVACNTATSVAISELRRRYSFPIIGMEPAIKPAISTNSGKKILVLATSLTLRESKLRELISSLDKKQRIRKLDMDRLVSYAEGFNFNSDEVALYIREQLSAIDLSEYETIVLGCTHFIYFSDLIQKIAGRDISIIDGNEGTVRNLVRTIEEKGFAEECKSGKGGIRFYSSGMEDTADRVAKLLQLLRPGTEKEPRQITQSSCI